jgi:hypothetical protein
MKYGFIWYAFGIVDVDIFPIYLVKFYNDWFCPKIMLNIIREGRIVTYALDAV